jgi:hypothetical protein
MATSEVKADWSPDGLLNQVPHGPIRALLQEQVNLYNTYNTEEFVSHQVSDGMESLLKASVKTTSCCGGDGRRVKITHYRWTATSSTLHGHLTLTLCPACIAKRYYLYVPQIQRSKSAPDLRTLSPKELVDLHIN